MYFPIESIHENEKIDCVSFLSNNDYLFELQNKIEEEELFLKKDFQEKSEFENYYLIFKNTSEKTELKNSNETEKNNSFSIEISEKKEEEKYEKKEDSKNDFIKKEEILPPTQYTYDKIINTIFPKINLDFDIKKSFIKSNLISDLEKKMSDETFLAPKKRNREKQPEICEEIKKLGRKKKKDPSFGKHNKDSEDNIVKKIKSKLLFYLLKFINSILNSNLDEAKIINYIRYMKKIRTDKEVEKEDLIKDLDYKIIVDKMKKEKNLDYLTMSLKDFLSNDISPKFSTYPKDSNKRVIEHIIRNEQDNEIINFIFNDLTFGDWFDIFIYKKELKEIKNNLDEQMINKLMNEFIRVEKLLEEIYKSNNGNNYFACFISILYNLERWFFIKIDRKRIK